MENFKHITEYGFFKKLCAYSFVDEIWLYGSRARGDNGARSDFDIAIVCPRAMSHEWVTLKMDLEDADTLFKIDCVRFDALSNDSLFKKHILKDRVILYQRKESHAK